MSKYLLLLPLLFSFHGFSQTRQVKMSIYFDPDKAEIRKDAAKTLQQLTDSIKDLHVTCITVKGNTDNRGDSLYNIDLSERRVQHVIDYLVKKKIDQKFFYKQFFGENDPKVTNDTESNKQTNRRVDIIVSYRLKQQQNADALPPPVVTNVKEPETPKPVVKPDPCLQDTTIILANGTHIEFNKCEYLERKDCLNFKEITNASEVRANGLNTMTTSGDPLISGGMLDLSPKPGCKNSCFTRPLTVRMPVPPDAKGREDFGFYSIANGAWRFEDKSTVKIVKIDGVDYFEFQVKCPGKINMDKPGCGTGRKTDKPKKCVSKTTIKIPRRYRIAELQLASDSPLSLYTYSSEKHKLKKIPVPCHVNNSDVLLKAVHKRTGDTLVVAAQKTLNQYKKRYWCSSCGKSEETDVRKLGLIPFKKRGLYRKYIIRKSDLVREKES